MEDNGLLEYYKNKFHLKNGYLNSKDIKFKHMKDLSGFKHLFKVNVNKKPYYIKTPRFIGETDAEVLLGQVYAKAGLKSAIYLPIEMHYNYGTVKSVISNDALENGKTAAQFCDFNKIRLFPTERRINTEQIIRDFFLEKALSQTI